MDNMHTTVVWWFQAANCTCLQFDPDDVRMVEKARLGQTCLSTWNHSWVLVFILARCGLDRGEIAIVSNLLNSTTISTTFSLNHNMWHFFEHLSSREAPIGATEGFVGRLNRVMKKGSRTETVANKAVACWTRRVSLAHSNYLPTVSSLYIWCHRRHRAMPHRTLLRCLRSMA